MTQEDKKLLLKDLCARLSYGIKCYYNSPEIYDDVSEGISVIKGFQNEGILVEIESGDIIDIEDVKPYLRPMSNMTENEKEEILTLFFGKDSHLFYINDSGVIDGKSTDFFVEGINNVLFNPENVSRYTDWLNKKMFDYRGLIPMGLSLEATDGMYNK